MLADVKRLLGLALYSIYSLVGQSDVALRKRLAPCFRVDEIVHLGFLDVLAKSICVGKAMNDRDHPLGEALGFPNMAQTDLRVFL